jgi:hypothetical protein
MGVLRELLVKMGIFIGENGDFREILIRKWGILIEKWGF